MQDYYKMLAEITANLDIQIRYEYTENNYIKLDMLSYNDILSFNWNIYEIRRIFLFLHNKIANDKIDKENFSKGIYNPLTNEVYENCLYTYSVKLKEKKLVLENIKLIIKTINMDLKK